MDMLVSFSNAWQQGNPIQDAFRRGLGYAVQWYDILQVHIEREVESALQSADDCIQGAGAQPSAKENVSTTKGIPRDPDVVLPNSSNPMPSIQTPGPGSLAPGQCSRLLQQRCPACFAGLLHGRSGEK